MIKRCYIHLRWRFIISFMYMSVIVCEMLFGTTQSVPGTLVPGTEHRCYFPGNSNYKGPQFVHGTNSITFNILLCIQFVFGQMRYRKGRIF